MSTMSSIEWTDVTWNPVRGCALVSEGCRNCYAMKVAHRFSGAGGPYEGLTEVGPAGPRWTGRARTVPDALREPLLWRKPRRVFVNSMSDLFHEDVPDAFIDQVFAVMALSRRHTFQILTKRPGRMREYCSRIPNKGCNQFVSFNGYGSTSVLWGHMDLQPWPLPNVWLGVSCEHQKAADERIPLLLQTPAAVRFVSAEPLLGPIDFITTLWNSALVDEETAAAFMQPTDDPAVATLSQVYGIDWVIFGGESGPRARPCSMEWIKRGVEQCRAAGVASFVKQLGAAPTRRCDQCGRDSGRCVQGGLVDACGPTHAVLIAEMMRLRDRKGGDPAEWPDEYRVRQFPRPADLYA